MIVVLGWVLTVLVVVALWLRTAWLLEKAVALNDELLRDLRACKEKEQNDE